MLEIVSTIAVWLLFVACLVSAGYVIFFPLVRTVAGGLQILKIYGLKRSVKADLQRVESFISDLELGVTMADGGEKTEKEKGATTGNKKK